MKSVILCGGSGTRLWPLSRKNFPKQFLKLYSDKSLLQETFLRLRDLMPLENIFFLSNQENFFNVFNQIKEVESAFSKDQILVEPASLNTAPAITYAVKYLLDKKQTDENEPIIFLPSDHFIGKKDIFQQILKNAVDKISDRLGTIGITPDRPETGYGYIKKGTLSDGFYQVDKFVEKPNLETANNYLLSGDYLWNSGIYLFNAKTFLQELALHAPEIYAITQTNWPDFINKFLALKPISIDNAISEKTKKAIVFAGNFDWSDIGSFDSLAKTQQQPINVKHINIDSENIFTYSANQKVIATIGVNDLVVVENSDSILIHQKGRGEDVKKVVEHLHKNNFKELEHNLMVHRPWGRYEILIESDIYKVKKITVYPQAKLSLQSHCHRAEHWVVVKGMAKIINGEEEICLRENESTFILPFAKHRLSNPGKINLEIIEVQTGNYLGEDDIQRYDDDFERI